MTEPSPEDIARAASYRRTHLLTVSLAATGRTSGWLKESCDLAEAEFATTLAAERERATLAERRRCAGIADRLGDSDYNDAVLHNEPVAIAKGYEMACRAVAAAIRTPAQEVTK